MQDEGRQFHVEQLPLSGAMVAHGNRRAVAKARIGTDHVPHLAFNHVACGLIRRS